jgi:hypothetical protein
MTGQYMVQIPQAVHRSSLMYRGAVVTRAVKFPASPSTDSRLAFVNTLIFGDRPISTNLGPSIQMAQSLVGKVLSSRAMVPPMDADFSTR